MEEFVRGEEKTYTLQFESVEKEDKKEPSEDESSQETSKQEEEFHEPPKKIEVVTGNANDLKISNVSDYLEVQKPKEETIKGNIIIPEEKKGK